MRYATLVIGLLLTSCASPPAPPVAAPEPDAPAATVLWSVPMVFEGEVPVITANVRDGATKFAIATSSSNHTLTKSFATAVRAPVSTTRQTTRVHGAVAEVEKVEGVVSIKSADAEWRLEEVVALDTAELDPRGIGGLLVPQALVSNTTTVVLDFKGGAITLVEGDANLFGAWFENKFGAAQKIAIQRDDGLLYIEVSLGGVGTRRVRLDTASPRSRFAATDLKIEVPADACVEGADLMMACLPGIVAPVESLGVGSASFPAWDAVAISDGDAVVGVDLLRNCILAVGFGNEAYLVCP